MCIQYEIVTQTIEHIYDHVCVHIDLLLVFKYTIGYFKPDVVLHTFNSPMLKSSSPELVHAIHCFVPLTPSPHSSPMCPRQDHQSILN